MTTTLLLIRHGQTEWNALGKYTGQTDIPLNETGRKQARQVAQVLRKNPPDIIVSSDLRRARETSDLIADACHITVITDPRLREIDQGVWEGMQFEDIKDQYAQDFAARDANPLSVAPPGGETVGQVQDRVLTAVSKLVEKYNGRRIAIVAHGLALALIKAHYTNYPITHVWDLIPPNAQVDILELSKNNK